MPCRLGSSALATIQVQDLVVLFPCHVLIPPDWMIPTVIATLRGCQWMMSFSVWDNWFRSLSAPNWERTNLLSWCVRVRYPWGWLSSCVCVCSQPASVTASSIRQHKAKRKAAQVSTNLRSAKLTSELWLFHLFNKSCRTTIMMMKKKDNYNNNFFFF